MLEIVSFEARRRLRGTLLLSGSLLVFAGLVIGLFPSIRESGVDFQAYLESLPPAARRAFAGQVVDFTQIEGFLAVELYQWLWLLVLGVYFAYLAASTVAGEAEHGSLDLLLVNPVSRTRVVLGKYLSLAPTTIAVNAIVLVGTYLMVGFVGESIDVGDLLALHGLSVVYLMATAAVGLLASVIFDAESRAQTTAAGAVFAMFLVDTLTLDTDYEWIGAFALTRYFDPTAILVRSEVDPWGIAVLLAAIVVLVAAASAYFERKDVE